MTVELSDRDYQQLVAARNAMGSALSCLIDNAEPMATTPAIAEARRVLAQYGEHQGFVVLANPKNPYQIRANSVLTGTTILALCVSFFCVGVLWSFPLNVTGWLTAMCISGGIALGSGVIEVIVTRRRD
ncbi:hypothetical protein CFB47_39335 [Burkholderia sp. AU27893]|jgi:hypothetical protein|nr:hypothetical protein [Burkholderia contaminans]OXI51568.1 hypothetical protein CFB47_39335 [Burkholderia sp. AU27893]MBA9842109.1 hypothetical protein [Burkholderia contaminans]MBA9867068.1 hypothetical protein [Burkholderia contaminans]MBA9909783.1 hypothetical protein [Burkholderia contaminans]